MLKRFFDPNQTVRHIPYKETRARLKREQEWSDKFVRVLTWGSLVGMALLTLGLFISSHW